MKINILSHHEYHEFEIKEATENDRTTSNFVEYILIRCSQSDVHTCISLTFVSLVVGWLF